MDNQTPLSNQEKYQLKKQHKVESEKLEDRKRRFKKIAIWSLTGFITFLAIAGIGWYVATRPSVPESGIVSRNGFHWHPELTIYVNGKLQIIPENIGLPSGMAVAHQPIHTHDDAKDGIVHMEFQGLVRKQGTTLGQFFKNWGKDMHSFGTNMKMTVNGQENTEYENYMMKDKDKIELNFE